MSDLKLIYQYELETPVKFTEKIKDKEYPIKITHELRCTDGRVEKIWETAFFKDNMPKVHTWILLKDGTHFRAKGNHVEAEEKIRDFLENHE